MTRETSRTRLSVGYSARLKLQATASLSCWCELEAVLQTAKDIVKRHRLGVQHGVRSRGEPCKRFELLYIFERAMDEVVAFFAGVCLSLVSGVVYECSTMSKR